MIICIQCIQKSTYFKKLGRLVQCTNTESTRATIIHVVYANTFLQTLQILIITCSKYAKTMKYELSENWNIKKVSRKQMRT